MILACALPGCGAVEPSVPAASPPAAAAPAYSAAYGGEPAPVELTADEAEIAGRLVAARLDGAKAPDPRLVRAARRHAAALASADRAPGEAEMDLLRWAVLAEGGTDYLLTPFVISDLGGGWPALAELVAASRGGVTDWGFGAARAGGRAVGVWLGSRRAVALESVPVTSGVGEVLRVRGRAAPGAVGPVRAFLGRPDGSAVALNARAAGGAFEVAVPLAQAGRHDLELQVDLGGGPETAALLPLYAGSPPDPLPTVAIEGGDAGTPDEVGALIFRLVNAARARLALPALTRDPRLDAVAAAHSADMVALGFFGHRSPDGGMLADRLTAAGLRPAAVGENVARSSSAARIHRNLMASPSHRLELLDRTYTHIGIGVAMDGDDLVVTEVLVRW